MGNLSFATALLAELETSGTQRVDAIVRHMAGGQIKEAAEIAHSLRGAAAIIGATVLQRIATEIELAGHNGETSHVTNLVDELRREWERCRAYIPVVRDSALAR
jgi:HPt (histidine-containing phosphotransfer) domain-containing protein